MDLLETLRSKLDVLPEGGHHNGLRAALRHYVDMVVSLNGQRWP